MREIEFVDRDEVALVKYILVDAVNASPPKVNHTKMIYNFDNLANSVELRARTIINEVTHLKVVCSSSVKWHYHRQAIDSVWKSF
ncbi:MAG: hypothetical protein WD038_11010 [Balneolales bacterium]